MKYLTFENRTEYKICFLVNKIIKKDIEKEYLLGINKGNVIVIDLYKDPKSKKTSIANMKEYLKDVLEICSEYKVEYICCCNSEYYKVLTKQVKAEVNIGYIRNVDNYKVLYVPDFKQIFYDPMKVRFKISRSLQALKDDLRGQYSEPGILEIKGAYPKDEYEIHQILNEYSKEPVLTCDIETYSLRPHLAGICSIAFAKNTEEGMAFRVDPSKGSRNYKVRKYLKEFFENYQGKLIFHNIAFDASVLIYQLFMEDIFDAKGLRKGLDALLRNFEDTKLIAYLATNTCAGNELGLKSLAHEFAGNWAKEEIADASNIPDDELLRYNLTDCLATWYVFGKYQVQMVQDNQEDIYKRIFIPATRDIVQMQLTGLPLNMERVEEVEKILRDDQNKALWGLKDNQIIKNYEDVLIDHWVEEKNSKLKVRKVTRQDAPGIEFNPRSHIQLQELLYDILHLPVFNKTVSGAPSTDAATLEALKQHTENKEILEILQNLLDFTAVDKILGTFIPAMKDSVYSSWMHWYFMIGNFNLGGTVSGRLSSSHPNLQQLPATGSKYAKLIKSCFQAPRGWVFCGLDFNALEDHISALTTHDQNKLKVYISHYDGHCLRAYSYFSDKMPDIRGELDILKAEGKIAYKADESAFYSKNNPSLSKPYELLEGEAAEVAIINSIKQRYKKLRQASKAPTFALTYQGTWSTLVKNCGFTEAEAKSIESKYHELYKESDAWVQEKLDQASKDGYITGAFGLRVRTPLLNQVVRGVSKTPKEAEAEGRTAGNALGQSYGLLNTRAGIEFNSKVRNSKYRYDIRPTVQIHDAQYFLIKDDSEVLLWADLNLVKAVSWQEDPAIWHPQVKLGGEFSIFYPNWASECTVPNSVQTEEDLYYTIKSYLETLK